MTIQEKAQEVIKIWDQDKFEQAVIQLNKIDENAEYDTTEVIERISSIDQRPYRAMDVAYELIKYLTKELKGK